MADSGDHQNRRGDAGRQQQQQEQQEQEQQQQQQHSDSRQSQSISTLSSGAAINSGAIGATSLLAQQPSTQLPSNVNFNQQLLLQLAQTLLQNAQTLTNTIRPDDSMLQAQQQQQQQQQHQQQLSLLLSPLLDLLNNQLAQPSGNHATHNFPTGMSFPPTAQQPSQQPDHALASAIALLSQLLQQQQQQQPGQHQQQQQHEQNQNLFQYGPSQQSISTVGTTNLQQFPPFSHSQHSQESAGMAGQSVDLVATLSLLQLLFHSQLPATSSSNSNTVGSINNENNSHNAAIYSSSGVHNPPFPAASPVAAPTAVLSGASPNFLGTSPTTMSATTTTATNNAHNNAPCPVAPALVGAAAISVPQQQHSSSAQRAATTAGQVALPDGSGRLLRLVPVRAKRSYRHESFPKKLRRMLDEAERLGQTHIVSFFPSGQSFKIHNQELFVNEIVPVYFQHRRFTSFRRQLSMYGFQRVQLGPEEGGFFHPMFLRDRPDLVPYIKRVIDAEEQPSAEQEGKAS